MHEIPPREADPDVNITDYEDAPFYKLLRSIPHSLALRHATYIEREGLNDEEATKYLEGIAADRADAMRETVVSDPRIEKIFDSQREQILADLEGDTFSNPDCHIGAGTTARIKGYNLEDFDFNLEVAVKYVTSPNEKTRSASSEHDVIGEVERIRRVEELEEEAGVKSIKVPHPYFHHKSEKVQCYGMERVDGENLHQINNGEISQEMFETFQKALEGVDEQELESEIEKFFEVMHSYTLHGDIKPRNLMLSKDGYFYVIDFGQAVLASEVPGAADEQFENLKRDEIHQTKVMIRHCLNRILRPSLKMAT